MEIRRGVRTFGLAAALVLLPAVGGAARVAKSELQAAEQQRFVADAAQRWSRPPLSISSKTATATAVAKGLPPKVEP